MGPRGSWANDDDASAASRQAGALFLLSGVLALTAIPTESDRVRVLAVIAVSDFAVALAAVALPWSRWGVRATALLALPGCAILGVSTWAFGGFAAGTGPFFVLLFVWLGLHHTRDVVLAVAPVAAIAYAGGLVAADADARLLSTTVVLIPIALAVGLVIGGRVRRLAQARDLIERQDRWRTALVTTLAHDVRTPLTAITGALELVADHDELPDQLKPLVANATRQASRLATLSATLLDAERIEQGKLRLDLESIDVREVADGAVQLAGHDDADVDVDIGPGLCVTADRVRLEQMLINLITNARRYGAPPVAIHALSMDGKVAISVRDHGPGVATEDQPRLFERLSPADHAPGSVGLGLWIVKMLAEAHHGDIAYRAAAPGAEFTITLPAIQPA